MFKELGLHKITFACSFQIYELTLHPLSARQLTTHYAYNQATESHHTCLFANALFDTTKYAYWRTRQSLSISCSHRDSPCRVTSTCGILVRKVSCQSKGEDSDPYDSTHILFPVFHFPSGSLMLICGCLSKKICGFRISPKSLMKSDPSK